MANDLASRRLGVLNSSADGSVRSKLATRTAVFTGASSLVLFLAGFFIFLSSLHRVEPILLAKADGIVVLTGGVDRITDGLDLLVQGHGRRMLISGVHEQVSLAQISQTLPRPSKWLSCCVDLDRQARNTVGNAEETRLWAKIHGYRSLVVVTSSYHMPRALLELKRHMPEVAFIAAPVVTHRLQGLAVWRDIDLLRTLGQEYAKFVVAYVRSRLTGPVALADITVAPFRRRA